jgi:hypothetical protein
MAYKSDIDNSESLVTYRTFDKAYSMSFQILSLFQQKEQSSKKEEYLEGYKEHLRSWLMELMCKWIVDLFPGGHLGFYNEPHYVS